MRIFVSAGEPSGDLHGANLTRALQSQCPGVEVVGFGGDRMAGTGAKLIHPLANHAIMGLTGIARNLPAMFRLATRAEDILRDGVGACVLIDYPGFHWHLAARAKKHGVPVFSFVPPQLWAWRSYRVRKMRALFDRVLCALPFEEAWFRERGLDALYVGHPYFDELHRANLDEAFIAQQRGGPIVALLPGSRDGEIRRNLETLVTTAKTVHAARPDVRFLVACFNESQRARVNERLAGETLPVETHVGRTPEILRTADVCAAVSGSVSLELLYHGVPSCVVYRVNPLYRRLSKVVLNVKHISLINLITGRDLFPEFLTSHDAGNEVAAQLVRWLDNPTASNLVRAEMAALKADVAKPGACHRAAEEVLAVARKRLRRAS